MRPNVTSEGVSTILVVTTPSVCPPLAKHPPSRRSLHVVDAAEVIHQVIKAGETLGAEHAARKPPALMTVVVRGPTGSRRSSTQSISCGLAKRRE